MKTLVKCSLFILFFSVISTSCKEDENITDQEKIENELKSFVESHNITKCSIREFNNGTYEDVIYQSTFKFSNGFIVVDKVFPTVTQEYRYNLLYLYNYRISDNNILFMEFVKN